MEEITSMVEHFSIIEDPRHDINLKHDLVETIVLIVTGVIAGCDSWVEIEQFGNEKIELLKKFLKLENGIPSHDTLGRVISLVDPNVLQESFKKWVFDNQNNEEIKHVALDGKTFKATSPRKEKFAHLGMVSAYSSSEGLCLGCKSVPLSQEKMGFQELLKTLDLKNCVVTIDAGGLTAKVLSAVTKRKGSFIVCVKKPNQSLLRRIKSELNSSEVDVYEEEEKKSHGRIEKRTCEVVKLSDRFNKDLEKNRNQKGGGRVGEYPPFYSCMRVTSKRVKDGKESEETRYYISDLKDVDAKKCCSLIRSHWEIENKLHWSLDVTFREDNCTVREKRAAENFGALRRFVFNLYKLEKSSKSSMRVKRKKAGWSDDYLLKVLGATANA